MTKHIYRASIDGLGRWTSLYRDGTWITHRDFYDPDRMIEGDEAEQMYWEFDEARTARLARGGDWVTFTPGRKS